MIHTARAMQISCNAGCGQLTCVTRPHKNSARGSAASRRAVASELCWQVRPCQKKGAGKAGCRPHPWPACRKKSRRQSPQDWPKHSGLPCAMGLTAAPCSPRGPGLLAPVIGIVTDQDTSIGVSGPHGLTVRLGFVRPHAKRARRPQAATAPPAPRSVTIAKRPFSEQETAMSVDLICPTAQGRSCPTECGRLARRAVWGGMGGMRAAIAYP